MQPDFLYQHLYQVRGDMLLGLYTSLHSQSECVQKMAFKVVLLFLCFNVISHIDFLYALSVFRFWENLVVSIELTSQMCNV